MKYESFILENWLNPACDSEKNRKLFGPYSDTKGLTVRWGDLLN